MGRAFSRCTTREWNNSWPARRLKCPASLLEAVQRSRVSTRAVCRWPRARISSAILRMASGCPCARRSATKVPTPCTRTRYPASVSSRNARLTVIREAPTRRTSSFSDGMRWAGTQPPSAIRVRMSCLIRSYSGAWGVATLLLSMVVYTTCKPRWIGALHYTGPKVMTAAPSFTRAPDAPALPATPLRFVGFFLREFRWWYVGMVLFETVNSTCGILIPYAMARIIRAVTGGHAGGPLLTGPLLHPLMLFAALAILEVLASRAAGYCQVTVGPRQRHAVTRALYAYLQQHSHRYLHNDFAGALAHRISETSLGVSQTVWAVLFDFWPMAITFSVATVVLWSAYPGLAILVGAWAACFVSLSWILATRP